MFWGLKLSTGNQYHSLVEKSFHVSHAVLDPSSDNLRRRVEVHVILRKVDYIVCILSDTYLQHSLNLEISEGEELSVYVKSTSKSESDSAPEACVHLTGYYIEECTDNQWEELEEESIDEDDGLYDCEEDIMFFDSDMDNDDDDSDSIPEYPSLAHLQQPTIQEVVSDEEKETNKNGILKGKRKIIEDEEDEEGPKSAKRKKQLSIQLPEEETTRKTGKRKKKKKSKISNSTTAAEEDVNVKEKEIITSVKKSPEQKYTKTFKNGLKFEEVTYGTGKVAKTGHEVSIRYTGQTTGANVIKECGNSDLTFRLGRGEVTSGLDTAIKGMRAGGTRKITIPSTLRREGDCTDDIPTDADLVLNVKLVKVT